MNAADVLKLFSAGYKPAEIRELSELEKTAPEAMQFAAQGAKLDEVRDLLSLVAPEDGTEPEGVAESPAESEPETDYKALYEELKKKTQDQAKALKAIQEQNARKDNSDSDPAQSIDSVLSDIITSFM